MAYNANGAGVNADVPKRNIFTNWCTIVPKVVPKTGAGKHKITK